MQVDDDLEQDLAQCVWCGFLVGQFKRLSTKTRPFWAHLGRVIVDRSTPFIGRDPPLHLMPVNFLE